MKTQYSTPVFSVDPESSVSEALGRMQANLVKHMVVASGDRPVGLVTERDIGRFLENDKMFGALDEIPIKHVMQKNVISISDGFEDHFNQCATRMETFKIGSVVLVGDQGAIVGIVTKTDIARAFSAVYGGKFTVRDFMSRVAVTCRKTDSLKFALSVMNRNEMSRLVVTDEDGGPEGLISTHTFLNHGDYSRGKAKSRDCLLPAGGGNLTVSDLMADELVTIDGGEDLASAAGLMVKNGISGIPVVGEKSLVGVISKFDVVRAFVAVGTCERAKARYADSY